MSQLLSNYKLYFQKYAGKDFNALVMRRDELMECIGSDSKAFKDAGFTLEKTKRELAPRVNELNDINTYFNALEEAVQAVAPTLVSHPLFSGIVMVDIVKNGIDLNTVLKLCNIEMQLRASVAVDELKELKETAVQINNMGRKQGSK